MPSTTPTDRTQVNVWLTIEQLAELDRRRGNTPRGAYMRELLIGSGREGELQAEIEALNRRLDAIEGRTSLLMRAANLD
jgi:hypothetical protein